MERYFLGSNTGYGFYGNYDKELKNKRKVILLKGGPGTGKSSILKKIAKEAKDRGLDYELWYCSGDPDSLDGVFIKDCNTAITDATAPHASGADLPKIKDFLYDLAGSLSERELARHGSEVKILLNNKKQHFMRVNQHLKTALCHYYNKIELERQDLRVEDIRAYAAVVAQELRGEEQGDRRMLFTRAICPSGQSEYFDHLLLRKIYKVSGSTAARNAFFEELSGLMSGGTIILNPLDPNVPDGFMTKDTAVVSDAGHSTKAIAENINLTAYDKAHDTLSIDEERNEETTHIALAIEELEKARECHLSAEKYFISAMDFDRNDRIYKEILGDIFNP